MSGYKYTLEELEKNKGNILGPFKNQPHVIRHNFKVLNKKNIEFGIHDLCLSNAEDLKLWNIHLKVKSGKTVGEIKTDIENIEKVTESLSELHNVSNLLTLFFNAGDWWLRIPSSESKTIKVLKSGKILKIEAFYDKLAKILNEEELNIFFNALDQFKSGLTSSTITNQYLSLFRSIEYLTDELYGKRYKDSMKMTKKEKDGCIKEYFKEIESIDKITRENIKECHDQCIFLRLRDKLTVSFNIAFKEHSDNYLDMIFKKDGLYEIRNSIVHGELSEYRKEDFDLIDKNIDCLKEIAREFLKNTILLV